jgi:hypothetical protein
MCEHNYQIATISEPKRKQILISKNTHTENEYKGVTTKVVTLFCTKCGEIKQHTIEE